MEMKKAEKTDFTYGLLSQYRSVLMGLQIVLIVFFHFTEDCKTYGVRFAGFIELYYTFIRSSGVDLFLLLSGLGLFYSWKRRHDFAPYLRKRLVRLLVPYFLLAIPAWAIYYSLTGRAGFLDYLSDLFFLTFFTSGQKWLWYIPMMVACYLVFPLVYRAIEGKEGSAAGGAFLRTVLLCLISTVSFVLLDARFNELCGNIGIALARFPAFFCGVYLGKMTYENRTLSGAKAVLVITVGIILAALLGSSKMPLVGYYTRAFLNYSLSLLFVIGLSFLSSRKVAFVARGKELLAGGLAWIGRYTLELYMVHVVLRRIFKCLGFYPYRISVELALIFLSLLLSLLLSAVSKPIQKRLLS